MTVAGAAAVVLVLPLTVMSANKSRLGEVGVAEGTEPQEEQVQANQMRQSLANRLLPVLAEEPPPWVALGRVAVLLAPPLFCRRLSARSRAASEGCREGTRVSSIATRRSDWFFRREHNFQGPKHHSTCVVHTCLE